VNALQKGLLFAALQVALVSSLGAKLLWDRERLPRGWALTRGYDPDLPIRGRYLSVSLLVEASSVFPDQLRNSREARANLGPPRNVYLTVENQRVVAHPADHDTGLTVVQVVSQEGENLAALSPPALYFLSEHGRVPTSGSITGKLFVEVTVPAKGPPRPIRFASKVGDVFTPLEPR